MEVQQPNRRTGVGWVSGDSGDREAGADALIECFTIIRVSRQLPGTRFHSSIAQDWVRSPGFVHQRPEKAKQLNAMLRVWRKDVDPRMMTRK